MATATLSVAASRPRHASSLLPKPNYRLPSIFSSSSSLSTSLPSPTSLSAGESNQSLGSISGTRRALFQLGVGLLASSLMASDASATRIEYYATVGEPLCDLNYAKSGLGYCDISVGSGVEPPPGELINTGLPKTGME